MHQVEKISENAETTKIVLGTAQKLKVKLKGWWGPIVLKEEMWLEKSPEIM